MAMTHGVRVRLTAARSATSHLYCWYAVLSSMRPPSISPKGPESVMNVSDAVGCVSFGLLPSAMSRANGHSGESA